MTTQKEFIKKKSILLKLADFLKYFEERMFIYSKKISILFFLTFSIFSFSGLYGNSKIITQDLLFYADSAKIKEESFKLLESLFKNLDSKNLQIKIIGHTNDIGEPENELKLSIERANFIASYLYEKGFLKENITIEGNGGKKLKINKTDEINRRVELSLEIIEPDVVVSDNNEKTDNEAEKQNAVIENTSTKQQLENKQETKTVSSRKISLSVKDKNNNNILASVSIKKNYDKGEAFNKSFTLKKSGLIEIPGGDNVELLASASGFFPQKIVINENENKIEIVLEKIEMEKKI